MDAKDVCVCVLKEGMSKETNSLKDPLLNCKQVIRISKASRAMLQSLVLKFPCWAHTPACRVWPSLSLPVLPVLPEKICRNQKCKLKFVQDFTNNKKWFIIFTNSHLYKLVFSKAEHDTERNRELDNSDVPISAYPVNRPLKSLHFNWDWTLNIGEKICSKIGATIYFYKYISRFKKTNKSLNIWEFLFFKCCPFRT